MESKIIHDIAVNKGMEDMKVKSGIKDVNGMTDMTDMRDKTVMTNMTDMTDMTDIMSHQFVEQGYSKTENFRRYLKMPNTKLK